MANLLTVINAGPGNGSRPTSITLQTYNPLTGDLVISSSDPLSVSLDEGFTGCADGGIPRFLTSGASYSYVIYSSSLGSYTTYTLDLSGVYSGWVITGIAVWKGQLLGLLVPISESGNMLIVEISGDTIGETLWSIDYDTSDPTQRGFPYGIVVARDYLLWTRAGFRVTAVNLLTGAVTWPISLDDDPSYYGSAPTHNEVYLQGVAYSAARDHV